MSEGKHQSEHRLDFGHLVDKLFWALITGASIYIASEIKDLGSSVQELNKNMAVVLFQLTETKEHFQSIDSRVEKLEQRH